MNNRLEDAMPGKGKLGTLKQLQSSPDLRRVFPLLGVSALLTNILSLALPLAILQILDRVVVNQSTQTLIFLTLGAVFAMILEMVLREISEVIAGWLGARFEHATTVACLGRLMKVPHSRYQREEPGANVERILSASKVAEFYSGRALLVLFDLPFVVIYLFVIYLIGGSLVLVPLVLLLLFGILIRHFGRWMRDHVRQRDVLDDRRWGFLSEVLSSIHSVKTHTMESLMQRRYERLQGGNVGLGEGLARGAAMSANYRHLFGQVMIVCVVFACAWFVINERMTPGGLAACMMLSVRALQPLRRALTVWMRYQSFVAANARLNEVMQMPFEDDAGKPALPPLAQQLELRGVSLSYETNSLASRLALAPSAKFHGEVQERTPGALFSDLSMTLRAGECIGIRGSSGSGKSSLLALMNGSTRPLSGVVLADGVDIGEFAPDSVQHEIAILPHAGQVMAGTILENLTMFNPALKQEALELSHRLGLDRHIALMRHGYETMVGEGVGNILPIGVIQLISIVRVLVGNPSVLLFDEANMALDMEADKLLREYFIEQKGKLTLVLVTQRPSLMALADKVYTLLDGRLVEGVIEEQRSGDEVMPAGYYERPALEHDPESMIRRQFDMETDCSICLWPLLKALEWEGGMRELIEALPHLSARLELSGLCSAMSNLDFEPRRLECHLATLDPRLLPVLHLPHGRHAQVLLRRMPNGNYWVYDSESRCEKEVPVDSAATLIYLFKKKDELSDVRPGTWLGNLLLRFKNHILLSFTLTVVSTLLALTVPFFVRSVLDRVIPTGDMQMAVFMAFGVSLAIAADVFLRNLKGKILAYIAGRCEYILGSGIFLRIVTLPVSMIENVSLGKQIVRIKNLESLREFFIGPISMVAFEVPALIILAVAIGIINPWVLLVILTSILLFIILGVVAKKSRDITAAAASRFASARWEFLNESLTIMRSIRSANASSTWMDRFRELSAKYVLAEFRDFKKQARTDVLAQILGSSTGLLALSLSAYLVINGEISNGTMVATMMIIWRLTGPMQNIFVATTSLEQIGANARQVENLMKLSGEAEGGVSQSHRPEMGGRISFHRVSFRYNKDSDPVLLAASFTVAPGKLMVVTGADGAGKSTLLMLADRLYHPQAGTIRLDQVDIRQLTVADIRGRISYMPQQCRLFFGTIAQNLRLAHPSATVEEISWAVKMAGLEEDIMALPEGMNTRISHNLAGQLPYGFRQRLSLARTVLKPATLILLDEPGAGMDAIGEAALLRCLEWWRGRSTLIMVSNRPAHMRLADDLILLRQGNIVAQGNNTEEIRAKIMKELS